MPRDLTVTVRLTDIAPVRAFLWQLGNMVHDALSRGDDQLPALALRDALAALSSPYSASFLGEHAVHHAFGLTYANYLVVNRTLLQEMDADWQARFVRCLEELEATPWKTRPAQSFKVQPYDETTGRYVRDPIPHYRHGFVGKQPQDVGGGAGFAGVSGTDDAASSAGGPA